MKKLFYTLCLTSILAAPSYAQVAESPQNPDAIPLAEQEPYQQLIGYALEAAGAAFEEAKPLGKYKCESIFSSEGYSILDDYPCEIIVHSDTGPIVVRYQNIDDNTSVQIATFLKENQLTENIHYSKGRFRFAFEASETEENSAAPVAKEAAN